MLRFKWISKYLGSKSLEEVVRETKTIKVNGVKFTIRKINFMDYLAGAKTLQTMWATYQKETNLDKQEVNLKKIREHYRDVLLQAVVKPKLSLKEDGDSICIEEVLNDSEMTSRLYTAIITFTYGKKKFRNLI